MPSSDHAVTVTGPGGPAGSERGSLVEGLRDLPWLTPGLVIHGRYEIEGFVGRGGMGAVVSATHRLLGHRVAIKLLSRSDGVARERFLREARAVASMRSDHVVRVFDVGSFELGGQEIDFLVMELLEGSTLAELLKARGRLEPGEAAEILRQACLGVSEAHANGVVHRDLKPSNVFVTDRGEHRRVRILDFGVSKQVDAAIDDLTTTCSIVGSPGYMSPEQVRSSKYVSPRSDIWSLGVVLYQLLTGRLPFHGESMMELCANILTEPPAPLDDEHVPAGLRAIVERAMQKSPEARFADVDQLAAALSPFAGSAPTSALTGGERVPIQASPVASGVDVQEVPTAERGEPRALSEATASGALAGPSPRSAGAPARRSSRSRVAAVGVVGLMSLGALAHFLIPARALEAQASFRPGVEAASDAGSARVSRDEPPRPAGATSAARETLGVPVTSPSSLPSASGAPSGLPPRAPGLVGSRGVAVRANGDATSAAPQTPPTPASAKPQTPALPTLEGLLDDK